MVDVDGCLGCAARLCAAECVARRRLGSLRAGFSHLRFRPSTPARAASAPPLWSWSISQRSSRLYASGFRRSRNWPSKFRFPAPSAAVPERPYGVGVPYIVGSTGFVNPYPLGYPDTYGSDEQSVPADSGAEGYAAQAPDQGQPPPLPSWPATYAPQVSPAQSPVPEREEAVTLVFKDGRSPEQIHNYMLTQTTLYVLDPKRREIPL